MQHYPSNLLGVNKVHEVQFHARKKIIFISYILNLNSILLLMSLHFISVAGINIQYTPKKIFI